jgi:hypothetical protein
MRQRLAILALVMNVWACAAHQSAMAPSVMAKAPDRSGSGAASPSGELLDIRARLQIEVENVAVSSAQLRQLVQDSNGQVVSDDTSSSGGSVSGSFDIRVPAAKTGAFLEAAGGLGHVLQRNVTATDVSKEFHDTEILLHNLEATLQRYEELLAKATDVKDMLAIEAELARTRQQIDRVKGERQWLEDRVARSTIHVDLIPVRPELAPEPTAKFYPGLKASYFKGLGTNRLSYWGTGASIQFVQRLSIDLDVLRSTQSHESVLTGPDLLLLTFGGELYSDFLGGGRRRFLNPYLGFRLGYARTDGTRYSTNAPPQSATDGSFVLGATAGIELVRLRGFVLDLQEQGIGFIGNEFAPSFGIQSSLTARVVF